MVKIIGGLLCKNEANRWLREYLKQMIRLCDELVVIDDWSIDGTEKTCLEYTRNVFRNSEFNFENNESYLRELLFNECSKRCYENDWIIILDADELLFSIYNESASEILRKYLLGFDNTTNCVGVKLFDMWNDKQFREDNYWTAHLRYWPMFYRYKNINYTWNRSKLHCGRWPLEFNNLRIACLNDIRIKHMGWSTEQDRKNKYDRYMKLDGKGEFGILEQYESILDPNPNLVTL